MVWFETGGPRFPCRRVQSGRCSLTDGIERFTLLGGQLAHQKHYEIMTPRDLIAPDLDTREWVAAFILPFAT